MAIFQETFLENTFKQQIVHYFSGTFLDLFAEHVGVQSSTVGYRRGALSKVIYLEILYDLIS